MTEEQRIATETVPRDRAMLLQRDDAHRFGCAAPARCGARAFLQVIADKVAGGLGFEPRLAESESAVLPLDDPPPRPLALRACMRGSANRSGARGVVIAALTVLVHPGFDELQPLAAAKAQFATAVDNLDPNQNLCEKGRLTIGLWQRFASRRQFIFATIRIDYVIGSSSRSGLTITQAGPSRVLLRKHL